ncbi:1-acyl-sn-glycerol-3-phosphate acyltransferase [Parasphingopyxis sp.]|uniref:lysophospholipid acyltransferase family protein n=1 Tax=Parasphingopyxis sp. TaxID=1920299 RepID=UPI0026159743|nr:lysophospholipid acyltransferase family protein [Parasphingopyxis sp.]
MSTENPESYPPIGFFGPVRFLLRLIAMFGLLGVCLILHGGYRLAGQASPWPPRFLFGIAWILNIRIVTEGVPLKEDVFYVSNHLSWIDIPIIGGVTRSAFVAKAEIRRWPITGWLATLNHTVFVSRGDRLGVGRQIEELKEAIADHQPITIFPEGTTTDGTSLLPFKPSLFAVLVPPPRGIRVQPILLDFQGTGPEVGWIGTEGALHYTWRIMCRRAVIPVRIVFLTPFDPSHCNDRKEIAATAREQIRQALSASLGGRAVL